MSSACRCHLGNVSISVFIFNVKYSFWFLFLISLYLTSLICTSMQPLEIVHCSTVDFPASKSAASEIFFFGFSVCRANQRSSRIRLIRGSLRGNQSYVCQENVIKDGKLAQPKGLPISKFQPHCKWCQQVRVLADSMLLLVCLLCLFPLSSAKSVNITWGGYSVESLLDSSISRGKIFELPPSSKLVPRSRKDKGHKQIGGFNPNNFR